jgi:hypothetical protein
MLVDVSLVLEETDDPAATRVLLAAQVQGVDAPVVRLTGSLPQALSAFASLQRDFTYARRLVELMQEMQEQGLPEDPDERERHFMAAGALWTASVVRYRRCFESGHRSGFARMLTIPEGLRVDDGWLREHRDEHVAHAGRGNPSEPVLPVALVLAPAPAAQGIADVVTPHLRVGAKGPSQADPVRHLSAELARQCESHMAAINARIRVLALQRGLPALYAAAERNTPVRLDEEYMPGVA